MELSQFLRLCPLRSPGLMWLLGAGCSVSAGTPTASDMIVDFKRLLYCSELRKPLQCLPDRRDQVFRGTIESHFTSKTGYPQAGSSEEYSFYFEHTYPNERERRKYIEQIIANGRPSYGHNAFSALVSLGHINRIWTTNFDRLIEDAIFNANGSSRDIAVISLDNAHLVKEVEREPSRKALVKLHGDFQSRRLKNTHEELESQDRMLRAFLLAECRRNGLIVSGYSGRDDSILSVFESALKDHGADAFPNGFFWMHRSGSDPNARVLQLVRDLNDAKVDAHFIESETFDELMRDVLAMYPDAPKELLEEGGKPRRRTYQATIPKAGSGWPVIRLNAVPILEFPSICRRVACDLSNSKAIRDAIKESDASVVAMKRGDSVICFGSDGEVRRAFDSQNRREFDIYLIDRKRLLFDSAELGLLAESLCRALARERGLCLHKAFGDWFLSVSSPPAGYGYTVLTKLIGPPTGVVPGTSRQWGEAVRIKLHARLGQLYLVFEPTEWVDRTDRPGGQGVSSDTYGSDREAVDHFVRERSAKRYNKQLITYLDAWTDVFTGSRRDFGEVATFGIGDGIDAKFIISKTTAFSRRLVT